MTRVLFVAAWGFAAAGYGAAFAGWRWIFLTTSIIAAVLFMVWGFTPERGEG